MCSSALNHLIETKRMALVRPTQTACLDCNASSPCPPTATLLRHRALEAHKLSANCSHLIILFVRLHVYTAAPAVFHLE